MTAVDLGALGLDRGAHLLLRRGLRGGAIEVRGTHPDLALHLRAWARAEGHALTVDSGRFTLAPGPHDRWGDALQVPADPAAVASARWGLAPRGATVERSAFELVFPLSDRDAVWADQAGALYLAAAAAQWDPVAAIPWDTAFTLPDELEDAVVQVMTYLIENETAALVVPARFCAQVHPHFREVMQLLAIQAADEARHIEVFTRRAALKRPHPGLSTAGGAASLATLVQEPDFALASFLLSVLGEGSFLSLLRFLHAHAPDPVTRAIFQRVLPDESRHVAFGVAHLARHAEADPSLRGRLAAAIQRRYDALRDTAGLNAQVFDALILLAAGSYAPEAVARGWDAVQGLVADMHAGRRQRLRALGFPDEEADALAGLHTRNFM